MEASDLIQETCVCLKNAEIVQYMFRFSPPLLSVMDENFYDLRFILCVCVCVCAVSYTHLRAHET